jgi:uncharacterized protein involved in exopolysaccharide biosynthesis
MDANPQEPGRAATAAGMGGMDLLIALVERWKMLLVVPLLCGAIGLGGTYLIKPTFTATTVLLPPQQAQSAAVAALASLGALAGAVGGSAGVRSTADQYIALLQSTTVDDRIIDKFELDKLYGTDYRFQTRKLLETYARISADRRSGLISIVVDDTDPKRAAAIANAYVDQLRRLTTDLAVTEAQQRRAFFELQLKTTRQRLVAAQQALQASGFNESVLRTEPRAAADGFAKMQAEMTAAEVKLQTMRGVFTEQAPEYQQQLSLVVSLRSQLSRLEAAGTRGDDSDYVSKYREFKYQETLMELFARQFEAARIDESREGPLVQVVDMAQPPEYKSRPLRGLIAASVAVATFVALAIFIFLRHWARVAGASGARAAEDLQRLRRAFFGR